MRIALDSNVLSALWSAEPPASRVMEELKNARAFGGIVICGPVYVELAAHPTAPRNFVDKFVRDTGITIEFNLDEAVWRKTADAFATYAQRRRRSGGTSPKRLLADFLIAAHALLHADRLFTLDPSRYQQDFPELKLT
ncbi:MAG: type II toxin-antitoxin system VapC family toxin [Candidatus Sulfotelmatobacter sp.]